MKIRFFSAMLAASLLSAPHVCAKLGDEIADRLPPKISDRIRERGTVGTEEVSETSAEARYNWYCRHLSNGEIPPCPAEMSFISEHGGIYLGDTDEKVIYLTFDAGYENGNIEKILNTMKEKEVTGAFFVLENIAKQNAELLRRMADEGHLICNHTARHKNMANVTDASEFKAELDALNEACDAVGVKCAPFYRPPEGSFSKRNLEVARELGYTTVFWSFAYADWDNALQPSPEAAKKKLIDGTHNGMILLLHPTSATNAAILGELIDSWKGMGYRFGSLSELVSGDEGAQTELYGDARTEKMR